MSAQRPRSAVTVLADWLLWLAENYYRWQFWRFNRALQRQAKPKSANTHGVLMVTRALNPCGSIRQAMLLLQQLAYHEADLIGLLVLHLDSESNRFYLPTLLSQNIHVETLQTTFTDTLPPAIRCLPKELRIIRNYLPPIGRHHPKLLHAWQDGTNLKIGLAGLILGIPKIVLSTSNVPPCHFLFYRPYMRQAYRLLSQQQQVVIVNNSEYGARAYERWLNLAPGTVKVIRNSLDFNPQVLQHAIANRLEYRRQIPIPPQSVLIGSVMRLTEEKRPLLWLAIAAELHRRAPTLHFLLIGDGPLKQVVREQIERDNLGMVVHLMPEEKRLLDALAAMDLMLLTSRATGLANAVIEAQAVNVPVVMTQAGGALEAILPNETGWEIPADDPAAAATQILALLDNQDALAKAAKLGAPFVQQQFGVQRLYDQYLQLYRE